MSKRTLLACGGLWVVVCLIGADIGRGAEPGYVAPASDPKEERATGPAQAGREGAEREGKGYADAAHRSPASTAAEGLSGPGGVSYRYDALGRVTEIVRLPGN